LESVEYDTSLLTGGEEEQEKIIDTKKRYLILFNKREYI
tara:strand:+ start:522 stop:638 length:117 start_codon:yes stop_codon:yes gene_type:complete